MANGFIGGAPIQPLGTQEDELLRVLKQRAISPEAAKGLQSAGRNQFQQAAAMKPKTGLGVLGQIMLGVGGLARQDQARTDLQRAQEQALRMKGRGAGAKPKFMNIGGNLVKINPDGTTSVEFTAPPKPQNMRYVSAGNRVIGIDPNTGQASPVYTSPGQQYSDQILEALRSDPAANVPDAQPEPPPPGGFQAPPPILSPEEQENYVPGPIQQEEIPVGQAPVAPQTAPVANRLGGVALGQQTAQVPEYAPEGAGEDAQGVQVQIGNRQMSLERARQLSSALPKGAAKNAVDQAISQAAPQPGKVGMNTIDEGLINVGERIARLQGLVDDYDPDLLSFRTGAMSTMRDFADKFGYGKEFDQRFPGFKRQARKYYRYRANTIDNINRYIKEMTGAAMSIQEAARLRSVMPNMGDNPLNPFSGDGPERFKEKLDETLRQARKLQSRNLYLKKNGFAGDGEAAEKAMNLSQFDTMVNQRADALRASGMNDGQIRNALRAEFGNF